jgi:hypothetical protein
VIKGIGYSPRLEQFLLFFSFLFVLIVWYGYLYQRVNKYFIDDCTLSAKIIVIPYSLIYKLHIESG